MTGWSPAHQRNITQQMITATYEYLNGFGDASLKTITKLLEKGADPNGRNAHNETPLIMACNISSDSTHINASRHLPLISVLLRFGANPHLCDDRNLPPLFWTIEYNCGENELSRECKELINAGANVLLPQEPTWENSWKQELHQHIQRAQQRHQQLLHTTPPDVTSLTAADICLLANIGKHHDLFTGSYADAWIAHSDTLSTLLASLPGWLRDDIIANHPVLHPALGTTPHTNIACWSAHHQVPQRQREATP